MGSAGDDAQVVRRENLRSASTIFGCSGREAFVVKLTRRHERLQSIYRSVNSKVATFHVDVR